MKMLKLLLIVLLVTCTQLVFAEEKDANVAQVLECKKHLNCPYFFALFAGDSAFRNAIVLALKNANIEQPDWIPSGVATPSLPIVIGGRVYVLAFVCQPHKCGNSLSILYSAETKKAVGLFGSARWIGGPTPLQKKVLRDLDNESTLLYRTVRSSDIELPIVVR